MRSRKLALGVDSRELVSNYEPRFKSRESKIKTMEIMSCESRDKSCESGVGSWESSVEGA